VPLRPGEQVRVVGSDPNLAVHLGPWARARGHHAQGNVIVRGDAGDRRLAGAVRAGSPGAVVDRPPATWGLAVRGALVEAGGPPLIGADLDEREVVWTELAAKLYAQAAAGQWDPGRLIDWTPPQLPDDVETAVVQVMTYLVENEQAGSTRTFAKSLSSWPPRSPTRHGISRSSPAGPV
jgi:hypothetical protein